MYPKQECILCGTFYFFHCMSDETSYATCAHFNININAKAHQNETKNYVCMHRTNMNTYAQHGV